MLNSHLKGQHMEYLLGQLRNRVQTKTIFVMKKSVRIPFLWIFGNFYKCKIFFAEMCKYLQQFHNCFASVTYKIEKNSIVAIWECKLCHFGNFSHSYDLSIFVKTNPFVWNPMQKAQPREEDQNLLSSCKYVFEIFLYYLLYSIWELRFLPEMYRSK